MKASIFKLAAILVFGISIASCNKEFLELKPGFAVDSETALLDSSKLEAFMLGMYDLADESYFIGHIILAGDARGGDVIVRNYQNYERFVDDYQYNLRTTNYISYNVYLYGFKIITAANLVINTVPLANYSESYKNQVIAEARALRSMAYYYMSRIFCHPYSLNPSSKGLPVLNQVVEQDDEFPSRGTVQELYDFMVADFEFAKGNIGSRNQYKAFYLNASSIDAFLARIYLEMGNWNLAGEHAWAAHENISLQPGQNTDGFEIVNSEWILGLSHREDDNNGYLLVSSFYEPSNDGYSSFKASQEFVNLYDGSDERLDWFGDIEQPADAYKVTKFAWPGTKKWDLDQVLIRRAEMYLIEAEALAEQNLFDEALAALNHVQSRSNSILTPDGLTKDQLISDILLERKKELFGEGFAVYDLQRRNLPLIRTSVGHWHSLSLPPNDNLFLYPIPKVEMDANPNMEQNDGYN